MTLLTPDMSAATRAFVYTLMAATVTLLLAGCGAGSLAADAHIPASGSTLTIGVAEPVNSLNPVTIVDAEETNFAHFVWAGLLGIYASGNPFPMLAASVPTQSNGLISADGKSITFVLRPNLKWSDGRPITARDVRFGWQVAIKTWADLCPATCPVIRDVIASIPNRVTFLLRRPYDPLLFALPPVLPRHQIWKGSWSATFHYLYQTGTSFLGPSFAVDGPYRVESATASTVTFERNPEWHILTRPAFSHVAVNYYATDPALLSAVSSGQVDLSQDFQEVDISKGIITLPLHNLSFRLFPTGGLEHLEPNLLGRSVGGSRVNLLSDVRVRQALSLAIDRRDLLHTALKFPLSATKSLPAYGPEMPGRFDGLAVRGAWDPLKHRYVTTPYYGDADKLLTMAGWHLRGTYRYRDDCKSSGPGCRLYVEMLVPKLYFNRLNEANTIAKYWKNVGVRVDINAGQWGIGNLVAPYEQSGPCAHGWFDLCLFAQVPGTDPQTDFQYVFPSDRIARVKKGITDLNFAGVHDRVIDHVFATGPAIYNLGKRAQLYRQWQIAVTKSAYWIPLFQQPLIVIQRKAIAHFEPSPAGAEWNPWALGP